EDYTDRGNIITPLRDRINSQIMTHYPQSREQGMEITGQESWVKRDAGIEVAIPGFVRELVEEVAIQARKSEYVDQNSGVSARLPIALIENLVSNAERRGLVNGEARVTARICDLQQAVSAVSGKVELVLEGGWAVKGLGALAAKHLEPHSPDEAATAMELVLEGLHQHSMLSRERTDGAKTAYKDMLKSMLSGLGGD